MKRIFILAALAAVVSISGFADSWPWPCCPNVVDPTGLRRPPVIGQVAWYRFKDGSEAIVQRLICRDTNDVLWLSYDVYNCPENCEALDFPASVPWYFTATSCRLRMRAIAHEVIHASR